ncbi:hypothetical protein [Methylobacterium sp. WSM2598]|uniref:hypothetical protein n=1 Tax=Methylobacterium sp. WSM2598 TaxID=398261 RepID=UPI00036A6F37|nr:hypothetical protein [Methylobacterium sp. WSM2598]
MPKLSDRLARLEAVHADQARGAAAPPNMLGVLIYACAISLGGYPRPPQPPPSYLRDCPGDGFARALGFSDGDDLRLQIDAHPNLWRERFDATLTAMFRTQGVERTTTSEANQFRALVRILATVSGKGGPIGWRAVGADLDSWMMAAGFDPAAIRAEARA